MCSEDPDCVRGASVDPALRDERMCADKSSQLSDSKYMLGRLSRASFLGFCGLTLSSMIVFDYYSVCHAPNHDFKSNDTVIFIYLIRGGRKTHNAKT